MCTRRHHAWRCTLCVPGSCPEIGGHLHSGTMCDHCFRQGTPDWKCIRQMQYPASRPPDYGGEDKEKLPPMFVALVLIFIVVLCKVSDWRMERKKNALNGAGRRMGSGPSFTAGSRTSTCKRPGGAGFPTPFVLPPLAMFGSFGAGSENAAASQPATDIALSWPTAIATDGER